MKRPTLSDPAEFAIIKKIYFNERPVFEKLDPIEWLERTEAKQRNNHKSSR